MTLSTPTYGKFVIPRLTLHIINQCTKFEASSFNRQIFKIQRYLTTTTTTSPPQSHLGRACCCPHDSECTLPLCVLAVVCTLHYVTKRYGSVMITVDHVRKIMVHISPVDVRRSTFYTSPPLHHTVVRPFCMC